MIGLKRRAEGHVDARNQPTFHFSAKPDYDYEDSIVRIKVVFKLDGMSIGSITGHIIERGEVFFEYCDSISAEIEECAANFFEEDGQINAWLSGKVSRDCNFGGFLYIDTLEIDAAHRGNDLGLQWFTKLLDHSF